MPKLSAKKAEAQLVVFARSLPQAWEDHPWDHTVFKIGKKVFVFFGGAAAPKGELSVTVKLPVSAELALTLPDVEPAGYGLGRAGWVHIRQRSDDDIDMAILKGWILQSYRAIAPKRLQKELEI